jgi:hypothetical protein
MAEQKKEKKTFEAASLTQALANFKKDLKRLHPRAEDHLVAVFTAANDLQETGKKMHEELSKASTAFINSRRADWEEFLERELEAGKQ